MPTYSRIYLEYERDLGSLPVRRLHAWERDVLRALAEAAGVAHDLTTPGALEAYRVRDLPDYGAGSIRFVADTTRQRGKLDASTLFYTDADGIVVSFTLDLDSSGEFWEIEAMKIDGSDLCHPPRPGDLTPEI